LRQVLLLSQDPDLRTEVEQLLEALGES
jgi:hypothetical protein